MLTSFKNIFIHWPGIDIEMDSDLEVDQGRNSEMIPDEADFVLGCATVPGYVSYRSRSQGSWFVNKLVEMLDKYAGRWGPLYTLHDFLTGNRILKLILSILQLIDLSSILLHTYILLFFIYCMTKCGTNCFFLQIWPVEYLGEGEWGSGASQCPSWGRSLQTNPCPPCNPQKKTLLSMICTNPLENSIFLLCLWNQCDVYRWTSASFQCTTHGQIYMYVETDTCTSTVLCYFFGYKLI